MLGIGVSQPMKVPSRRRENETSKSRRRRRRRRDEVGGGGGIAVVRVVLRLGELDASRDLQLQRLGRST